VDPLPLKLVAAGSAQGQPVTVEGKCASFRTAIPAWRNVELTVVDELAVAYFECAAVAGEAQCCIGVRGFGQYWTAPGARHEQRRTLTVSELNDHVPVRCVHQIA